MVEKSHGPSRLNFTKANLDALPSPDPGKRAIYHDIKAPGLQVRVTSTGVKTFSVFRRINGAPERVTIGRYPDMTPEQARREAAKVNGEVAKGISPRAERQEQQARAITLAEVFAAYLASRDLKPGTVHDYQRVMTEAFPDWQAKRLLDITRDMVERRHVQLGERSPARANNAMRVLRALLNFAAGKYEDARGHPLLTDIATRRLSATRQWFRVERRQTVIRPIQLAAWWAAVDALDSRTVADYLKVLVLTGLRRTEAAGLTWDRIDLADRTLTISDTKNRRRHVLPLGDYLLDLFKRRQGARPGAYVFPATTGTRYLVEPRKSMDKVTAQSGVEFTPHDLRRTFITIAESLDIPAYALKRLLNHKDGADVTGGYIVTDTERLRRPMQQIEDFILKAAGIKASAEVVDITRAAQL